MNASNHPVKKFPDALSLVLGATITAVVLLSVYFVLPAKKSESPLDPNSSSPPPSQDSLIQSNPNGESVEEKQGATTIRTLADLLDEHSSRFLRFATLYQLANQLDEDRLVFLIDEIVDFDYDATNQKWRTDALSILISKLVHSDEEKVHSIYFGLNEDTQRKLAYSIASEWATVNLEGAKNFVKSFSEWELKVIASDGVLDAQSSLLSIDDLKLLAEEFENEKYVSDLIERNLFIEEARYPEQSWNVLAQDPTQLNYENFRRITNIAEAWIEQIGVNAIPRVTEVIEDQSLRDQLQYRLLRVAALQDAKSAFEYAITLPHSGFSNPASPVLSIWAENDPLAAWERISILDTASEREDLTQELFSTWVSNDAQSLKDSLGKFPNEVQDVARAILIIDLVKESPEAARAMYDEIENSGSKRTAARTLANYWGRTDGVAALNWVLIDPSTESQRPILVQIVITEFTNKDSQTAFELARDQPIGVGGDEIGLEATVIDMLTFQNLEEALKLLPLVREGPTKLAAYRDVGYSLIRNDRLDEAIANGEEFSGEDQIRYYTSIGSNVNVMDDPESIFTRLDQLPSEMARSRIATTQLANNRRSNVYDEDQVDRLKEYLTDEDRKLLFEIEEEGASIPDAYLGY
ncbi:MAG: hypothetical protein F4X56_08910 [Gammaproteobacteria bacterium]|nr:hypothetical protein [Gammaproteobacteria bacterium]